MTDDLEISDASALLGMANLLNNSEIDNSLKPKNIEKELIQNSLEFDSLINHNDELMNYNPINEYNQVIDNIIDKNDGNDSDIYNDNDNDNDNNDNNKDDDAISEIDELITMSSSNNHYNNNNNYNNYESNSFSYKLTEEQKNQKLVDSVLDVRSESNTSYNNAMTFNIDDENREDLKVSLLEKIDNLMEELEDDGISLDKIPRVDYNTDLEKIEYVTKLLMLKSNRNRYASLGEEFILAMASGLEMVCNGDREFFGLRPDLHGYSDVVKVKLRRLRNETSQVVGNVVEKYEISPFTTLLIELIPSLFLHSKRRKNQISDNLYNDLSDDINEIRKYN
jgi:hypothetical protein